MGLLNRRENSNAIAGLFLLVLLAVFAGPTVLPQLLSENVEFVDEGVPCSWLRDASERATHQSLIGRAAAQNQADPPMRLRVRTGSLPAAPTDGYEISVVITNETIGTLPFVLPPTTLILDPANPISGLGVVFNNNAPIPNNGEQVGSYPDTRIRLLGPRQTCVYTVTVPFNSIPNSSALTAGNASVRAFYRNAVTGGTTPRPGEATVYNDQGLWIGVVESSPQTLAATR